MPEAHTYARGNTGGAIPAPPTGISGTSGAATTAAELGGFREAVCMNSGRVYDSCSSKDCLEDLRVYLNEDAEKVIAGCSSLKCRSVDVLHVAMDVEGVPFNPGFYSVDMTFYFLVTLDAYNGQASVCNTPQTVQGISVFQKKVILFGSEGSVRSFRSDDETPCCLSSDTPVAQVQTVDPICLNLRITDCPKPESDTVFIPPEIGGMLGGCINLCGCGRYVYMTIGLFSIVSLEREIQMMVPVYDFCVPEKECVSASADDPCQLFQKIRFPVNEFFPPKQENDCD